MAAHGRYLILRGAKFYVSFATMGAPGPVFRGGARARLQAIRFDTIARAQDHLAGWMDSHRQGCSIGNETDFGCLPSGVC